jgi:hypothetical protein
LFGDSNTVPDTYVSYIFFSLYRVVIHLYFVLTCIYPYYYLYSYCSDNQAIAAAKAAIASPRTPSCPLIECEFPPLVALNKLGDGSLQSANQVDKANLDFSVKLLRSIAPLPMMGPQTSLLLSSTATNSFLGRAQKAFQGGTVHSLKDGLPTVKAREVFVLVAPSVTRDYDAARRLVSNGNTVVLVNGFAKVRYVTERAAFLCSTRIDFHQLHVTRGRLQYKYGY